jgi:DNA-binding HxlR family transcriptional regulator
VSITPRAGLGPDATRPASVARTLEVFRDPWAFAILQEVFFGVRRFDDMQERLGISRNVLTKRLKSLVGHGVLHRARYQDRPDRFDYVLTDKGRALQSVFMAIMRWGDEWLDAERPEWDLIHLSCGRPSRPHVVCDQCGEPVDVRDVELRARSE